MFMARGGPRLRFDSSSLTPLGRSLRRFALALFAVLIAACSTFKVGYNNADLFLVHALDRYVSLTSEQEKLVRQRMASVMEWHRATQLRDYSAFIHRARAELDGNVSPAEVIEFSEGVSARLLALGERIAPDFAALALTLSRGQIDQLERKLSDDDAKARRETAEEMKKAVDARARKYAERAEFWLGKLNPQQLEIVRASLAGRPADSMYWIDARERRNKALVALLRRIQAERPPTEAAAGWIRAYFAELAQPSDAKLRARAEAFRRDNARLIAQLVNSATPEQQAHLDQRLDTFAAEFGHLANRGG
jgi:hypothetical protein